MGVGATACVGTGAGVSVGTAVGVSVGIGAGVGVATKTIGGGGAVVGIGVGAGVVFGLEDAALAFTVKVPEVALVLPAVAMATTELSGCEGTV